MLEFYGEQRGSELCVILPTYNERDNLPDLVKRVTSIGFSVIVVDDSSTDGTFEIAKDLAEEGKVFLIERKGEKGLATAIRVGIEYSKCPFVAVMDADFQHPPEVLPKMLEKLKSGCDLVIASRYTEGGRIQGWPLYRRIISLGAIFLAHLLLPETRVSSDPVSGFFAFRRDKVDPATITTNGYKALVDILVRNKFDRVCEVPYVFIQRKKGKSKLGSREIIEFVRQVMRLRKK